MLLVSEVDDHPPQSLSLTLVDSDSVAQLEGQLDSETGFPVLVPIVLEWEKGLPAAWVSAGLKLSPVA